MPGNNTTPDCGDIHGSKAEDTHGYESRSLVHVERPDDEHWQDTETPIRNAVDDGGDVGGDGDGVVLQAFTGGARCLLPEDADGPALEQDNHQVGGSKEDTADHEDAEEPDVELDDRETNKEQADGQLDERGSEDVEDLAGEPILQHTILAMSLPVSHHLPPRTLSAFVLASGVRSSLCLPVPQYHPPNCTDRYDVKRACRQEKSVNCITI